MSMFFTYGQSTYEFLYQSPLNEISRSLNEDEQGNIYFSVENFQYALIIKLDHDGSFLDSISIYNHEGTCNLAELIKIDDDYFVALGNWTIDTVSELWFVKFNHELQIIDDKKLISNSLKIYNFHHIIRSNGNIVFIAHYQPGSSPAEYKVCIYELTPEGDLVRYKFFNQAYSFNIASTIIEDSSNFCYKLFSLLPVSYRMSCNISYIDTSFNVTDSLVLSGGIIRDQNTAKWINDSIYLLTGRSFDPSQDEFDIGILKMTANDSLLNAAYFGKTDTVDYTGLYKNLDFISKGNIFFSGESNIKQYFQTEPSWIMLNILDSNLNLKNQRFYGGDAFYLVNAILATQDSGCVLSCSRYDYLTQNEEFDIYILKVNQDGLLVSTTENPIINSNACFIYPNPGNETLNINSPIDRSQIQLFDLTGRLECEAELSAGTNSIPVSSLPAGIYLYRIFDHKSQIIQSGKWIKL